MNLLSQSLFFSTLGPLLEAGMAPVRALNGNMPLPCRAAARRIAHHIENGSTLWEAMKRCGFSRLDVALTRAGETAGTLPMTCGTLRDYYEEKRALRKRYASAMAYPFFLYSFSVLISGAVPLIANMLNPGGLDVFSCVAGVLFKLSLPWLAILLWKLLSPLVHSVPASAVIDAIPFFGGLQAHRDCSLFLMCFGRALDAGIGMEEAIRIGADVCLTGVFRRRFHSIADSQSQSHLPFMTVAEGRIRWPEEIKSALVVGEMTGKFPEKADHCARILSERTQKQSVMLMKAASVAVLAIAMLHAVAQIFSFATGYVEVLNSI